MTERRLYGGFLAVIVLMTASSGCRFEDLSPEEGSLHDVLVDYEWSSYSEAYSSDRGWRVAFLPFNVVARESGRLSDTWRVTGDNELEITNRANRAFRYRWFEDARLFAFCREGFAKPFFIAPSSMSAERVFEVARRYRLNECTPATVLRIAGGRVEWAPEDRIKTVDLSHLSLTRQDRAAIRDVGAMETLILADAALSDIDLAYLAVLSSLTNLTLAETEITDEGLKFITDLPIRRLDLSSTHITDQGVAQLANISTLEHIYLRGTSVSPTALDSLQKRLPQLLIYM
jgi:hypothetical protein